MIYDATNIYQMFKSAGFEIAKAQEIKGVGARYFLRSESKPSGQPLARIVVTIDENITRYPITKRYELSTLWEAMRMLTMDAVNEAKKKGIIIDL